MREGLVTSQHWSCSNSVTLIEFRFSFLLCISHNVFSNCLFEMAFFLFSSLVIELIFHSIDATQVAGFSGFLETIIS